MRLQKGTTPPGVCGGGSKVKKKCINLKYREDKAPKGVGAACDTIRWSTWHLPETTDVDMVDAADYRVKNRYWSPLLEGGVK